MNKNILAVLVAVIFAFATFASAQEIKVVPRKSVGTFDSTPSPAPAPSAAPVASVSPSPTPEATPSELEEVQKELDETQTTLKNVQTILGHKIDQLNESEEARQKAEAELEKAMSWTTLGLRFAAFLGMEVLLGLIFILFRWMRRKTRAAAGVVILLGLTAGQAQAANTAPTPATKECTLGPIVKGSVVTQDQEAVAFEVATKNCPNVTGILADGLKFSETSFKPDRITAKVKTIDADRGALSFKILADGKEVESPDSVFFLIIDAPTSAFVQKEVANGVAKTLKDVASLRSTFTQTEKKLREEIDGVAKQAMTADQVRAMIAEAIKPTQQKLDALVGETGEQFTILAGFSETLAEGQSKLAGVKIKERGFLGLREKTRSLDPGDVKKNADEILACLEQMRGKANK